MFFVLVTLLSPLLYNPPERRRTGVQGDPTFLAQYYTTTYMYPLFHSLSTAALRGVWVAGQSGNDEETATT